MNTPYPTHHGPVDVAALAEWNQRNERSRQACRESMKTPRGLSRVGRRCKDECTCKKHRR